MTPWQAAIAEMEICLWSASHHLDPPDGRDTGASATEALQLVQKRPFW